MEDTLVTMVWVVFTLAIALSAYLTVKIYSDKGFR